MNPLNGLLLVDKPIGLTSHDVVARARRILGHRGIGHAGTLDPIASGLLVLLIGEATKVSDYLLNGDKGYEFQVRLGQTTDSMDVTGQILSEQEARVSEADIRSAAEKLSGTVELEVPIHSAVKVDGHKLYEYAHRGERPESVPTRSMDFYDVKVIDIEPSNDGATQAQLVRVQMKCSKGSFVRAWANRFGNDLKVGGCVQTLRRTFSSPFQIDDAIELETLASKWDARSLRHGQQIGSAWVPLKDALPHFRRVEVAGHDERLLKNGQISNTVKTQLLHFVREGERPPPVRVISRESDDLLALLLAEQGEFYKIKRVFLRH